MELRPALVDVVRTRRQKGQRLALLVRHAERGPIADLSRHEEVLLTESGHAAAHKSGGTLASVVDVAAFVHSPVPRCGETAAGLARGFVEHGRSAARACRADVVGVDDALGASYLRDKAKLALAYGRHGKKFVRAWFDGEVDTDAIDPCEVVANRQLNALTQHLRGHELVVAVSHDWNIAAVREHALGLRFEDVGWPNFLDGVVVAVVDGRVVVDNG